MLRALAALIFLCTLLTPAFSHADVATTKAKVFLGQDDVFTVSNNGATVYGGPGTDTVIVVAGASGIALDQNVERIVLPNSSSSYTFLQGGNMLKIYESTGAILILSIPVQSKGTWLSFSNGTAAALLNAGVMTLGGSAISTTSPTTVTPTVTNSTPVATSTTKAKVFLGVDDYFTVRDSGTTLYGGSGKDFVTLAAGVSGVSLDQNVEQITLTGASNDYAFKQTGNTINVYDGTCSTLIVSTPVQGDSDGTVFTFSDSTASALISAGVMSLAGMPVSTSCGRIGDVAIIGNSVSFARISINNQPAPTGHLIVPYNREVAGVYYINIAADLNGDGKFGDYILSDGTTQREWIVRNMPAVIVPSEPNGFHFSLKDFTADTRTNLKVRVVITSSLIDPTKYPLGWDGTIPDTPVATRDILINSVKVENTTMTPGLNGGIDATASLALSSFQQQLSLPVNGTAAVDSSAISRDQAGPGTRQVMHKDVPNLKMKGEMDCVPTSTANSYLWLAAQNPSGFKDKMPATADQLIDELKVDTKFNEITGVQLRDTIFGKNCFINKHKLPVESHQVGTVNDQQIFDKIYAELDKGQDVEITLKYVVDQFGAPNGLAPRRHMVTVVGATDASGDGGVKTLHVHDPWKKDTNEMDEYEFGPHPLDGYMWIRDWWAGKYGATVEYVYADSPSTQTTPALMTYVEKPLSITHIKGQTECPTPMGSFFIQNSGSGPMSFTISGIPAWLSVDKVSGTLDACAETEVKLSFNCSNYVTGTQSANIVIKGTDNVTGTSAGEQTISVSLTVK